MKPKTKWMVLVVGVLVILSTNVNAELYGCRDLKGDPVITDVSAGPGIKDCVLGGASRGREDAIQQQKAKIQRQNVKAENKKDTERAK